MAKKSIKKNYIFNTCYQILLLLTPLITTPYISRVLGADGIGTVSFAESIVSYFVLFATLGISTYGQREISYVQDSKRDRSIVFWNTKILQIITSVIVLCVYFVYLFLTKASVIYVIFAIKIVSVAFDVTWFFQGMEEFGKTVLRNVIFKIINIVYVFGVIKTKEDVVWYAFGLAIFILLGNISLWGYLPKYIQKITYKDLKPFNAVPVVLSLFIPTIAVQVYTVLDKTMIGIITNSSYENGYYEQALKISRLVLMLVASLGTVMIPRIGYHFQKNDVEEVKRLMYRGYRFVWFLGIPLCFGLIAVADNMVPWFFGAGYDKVAELLKILAFIILAVGISNVTGMQYLIPTKRQNIFTLTVIIGAITNFLLNMILIRQFQSVGAAIASILAEIVVAILQLVIIRKELSIWHVLKEGTYYYIAGGIMLTILFGVGKILSPSIMHTAILVATGAIVYFVVLLLLRDEFLISNMKTVFRRLGKR